MKVGWKGLILFILSTKLMLKTQHKKHVVHQIEEEDGEIIVKKDGTGSLLILYFYLPQCSFCRYFHNEWIKLLGYNDKIIDKHKFLFREINAQNKTFDSIINYFNIKMFPSVIVVDYDSGTVLHDHKPCDFDFTSRCIINVIRGIIGDYEEHCSTKMLPST